MGFILNCEQGLKMTDEPYFGAHCDIVRALPFSTVADVSGTPEIPTQKTDENNNPYIELFKNK